MMVAAVIVVVSHLESPRLTVWEVSSTVTREAMSHGMTAGMPSFSDEVVASDGGGR
jgi:hypothetical protein